MRDKEEIFREYLRKKGLRFTPERKMILECIFSLHRHFDADQLYENMRHNGGDLSRATIYRALPLLVECNLIREVMRYKGRATYEHTLGHNHHDHMVCIRCGKIIEFEEERIERLQDAVCKRYGFEPVEHRLGISGYCKGCR